MKTFINFRPTTPLHYAKERWCDYLKPHSKLNTQKSEDEGKDVGYAPIVIALYEISDTLALIYDKMSEKESLNDKSTGKRGLV